MSNNRLMQRKLSPVFLLIGSISAIVLVAFIPLFFNLPFRDNIYLSWEGAYRIYSGQMPFKDFGMPVGYAFWLLPTLSFYIFGPFLFSLVKIQVFINIVSGLTFLAIIRWFSSDRGLVTATVLLYVVSFSFYNFWPWYNHTVIVFEFISLALLLFAILNKEISKTKYLLAIFFSALFCFLSFFTKQDGGAFALLICGIILVYYSIISKKWAALLLFVASYILVALLFVGPLIKYDFGYWFNYGQEPHYSRVSLYDFSVAIFGGSASMKLYLLLIGLIVLSKSREGMKWIVDQRFSIHLLLTLGVLFQAAILQVTSYVPADNNVYYHSFMAFFIIRHLDIKIRFDKITNFSFLVLLILFWWSGLYWKYAGRMFPNLFKKEIVAGKNIVSQNTFVTSKDSTLLDKSTWKISEFEPFAGVKLPVEAVEAVSYLDDWCKRQGSSPKILNMSEMTPLAEVLGFTLESGTPLWYHLNVAMFEREKQMFVSRIEEEYYDLVLFENIPFLNNFYPFEVRQKLKENYELLFVFQAPREMTSEVIEVYVKKKQVVSVNDSNSD